MSAMDEEQKRGKGWGVDRERRKRERANLRSGKVVAGEILMLCQIAPAREFARKKVSRFGVRAALAGGAGER
jgi:hypothetical protein